MERKARAIARVGSQKELCQDIYSLWLEEKNIAAQARPGQFVLAYPADGAKLLGRPISICEADPAKGRFRLVYRITGKDTGTAAFSHLKEGDRILVLGPLGNGFPLEEGQDSGTVLVGGGIGIPPMLGLAKALGGRTRVVLGFRDEAFLAEEFKTETPPVLTSDSGKIGLTGTVLDGLKSLKEPCRVLFACGPTPMLRGVAAYAQERGIPCWISLEERMACGIGACLGCVCKTQEIDAHTKVKNARICKDGPVFRSTEVVL